MNLSSDSWDEMQHESDPTDSLVAELIGELRSWAAEPAPAPSPALLALLDGDAESCVRATQAGPCTPPTYVPRRKKMIVAKLAGLGVAAKAALGLGVATAAVATAGVAGVLPGPTGQVRTDVTVTVPTSITTPDVSIPGVSIPRVTIPKLGTLAAGGDEADDDAGDDIGDDIGDDAGKPEDNHGACVSAVARDDSTSGREHGRAVSAVAQSDCGKPPTPATSPTSTPTLSNAVSPNHGPGNANGNSNGNGESSNSGRGSSNSGSGSSNRGGRN